MDPLTAAFDVLFLLLAALVLRGGLPIAPLVSTETPSITVTPAGSVPNSPLPSSDLVVPSITLTPEGPSAGLGTAPTRHKRKSVSFSLSSMDDVLPHENNQSKRPPTPWVSGPVSPNTHSPVPSLPSSPIAHSKDAEDPMGVKKQWLMVQ